MLVVVWASIGATRLVFEKLMLQVRQARLLALPYSGKPSLWIHVPYCTMNKVAMGMSVSETSPGFKRRAARVRARQPFWFLAITRTVAFWKMVVLIR